MKNEKSELMKLSDIIAGLVLCCFLPGTISTSCATDKRPVKRDVTCIIAADLHFDFLPESDQYYHVVTMNRVAGNFVMPSGEVVRKVDAVVLAGDLFDKARPEILELYRQRYEQGEGEKRIRYPVFPGFGNHDLDTMTSESGSNGIADLDLLKRYMDTVLQTKLKRREILNLHPSSRSYSWNIGDVHFIHGQRYAGDTSYCESNLKWLEADLKKYASKGNPVVYIQHYGTDDWAIKWWPQHARNALFNLLDQYNVAAFFAGHTHTAMIPQYRGYPIYQVNNAWPDKDGNGSFAVLRIKGEEVSIAAGRWTDGNGNMETVKPFLDQTLPTPRKTGILYHAFSHNDYEQENPLQDALSFRFNCVEADLWLIGGEVYVGHEKPVPDPAITFEALYLKPLMSRIDANRGKVYPGSDRPFFLMTEFKSEPEELYEVMKKKMAPYRKYLCSVDDGLFQESSVLWFISGKLPSQTLPPETSRYAFLDGVLRDIGKGIPASLTPVVSDHWQNFSTRDGKGEMTEEEYRKMLQIIESVHREGKLFRWWGAPDIPFFKQLFMKNGVDLVGTDNLNMLYNLGSVVKVAGTP